MVTSVLVCALVYGTLGVTSAARRLARRVMRPATDRVAARRTAAG
jgi:hypothetical protein